MPELVWYSELQAMQSQFLLRPLLFISKLPVKFSSFILGNLTPDPLGIPLFSVQYPDVNSSIFIPFFRGQT
jgi:hypothetical protein